MRRLDIIDGSSFSGHQIDRNAKINFVLNDIKFEAFKGDSILSALLASKICCAGNHNGFALALNGYLNLTASLLEQNGNINFSAPISRMPVVDGATYLIKHAFEQTNFSNMLSKLSKQKPSSLNIDFDRYVFKRVDFSNKQKQQIEVELLIIGGGIAGLSAAHHGASIDKDVLLLEKAAWLGGSSVLFGASSEEEKPEHIISRLIKSLNKAKNAKIKTNSEVISLKNNIALAQQIYMHKGKIFERIIEIKAKKIVLATGYLDRLPVFCGNRLSNIIGLQEAFTLASAYGVFFPDECAIFCNNNIAYHFALLATDAGANIKKIFDNRIEVNSRFFEFAKSYGIKSETGLMPIEITQAPSKELDISMKLVWERDLENNKSETFNSAILAGGWLPNLSLWHQNSGKIIVAKGASGIRAIETIKHIALAGSNMGYCNNSSVVQSAREAVNQLFFRKTTQVVEKHIDPSFETPMGEIIATKYKPQNAAPKYYDFGTTLICEAQNKQENSFFVKLKKQKDNVRVLCSKAFSLGDMCTLDVLSIIQPEEFNTICEQRVVNSSIICKNQTNQKRKTSKIYQKNMNYLENRFGKNSEEWIIEPLEGSQLEVGQLIFTNSDISDPELALGTIISCSGNKTTALITKDKAICGQQVSIIGSRGHLPAKLIKSN